MKFFTLPLVAAFVGWITNYIAVKMLFRPIRPLSIFGLRIQGVIPSRIGQMAEKLANIVEKEFISVDDITKVVERIKLEKEVEILAEKLIDAAKHSVFNKIPIPPSVGNSLFPKLQLLIAQEMMGNLNLFVMKIVDEIRNGANPREIVVAKTQGQDVEALERMVLEVAGKELRYIEIYGGILGFTVGLIQLVLYNIF